MIIHKIQIHLNISNSNRKFKTCEKFKFQNDAPMLKYFHNSLNSCRLSSLEAEFSSMEQTKAVNEISLLIEESLKSEVGNHIDFANAILKNEKN